MWILVSACGGDDDPVRRPGGSGNPTGGGSASGGTGASSGGTGSGIGVVPVTMKDPNDLRDVPVRKKTCDDAGVCTCLRLALLGTLDSAANQKDTGPFTQWLNGKSNGTATVTTISQKPNVTADFLKDYDILLVANVNSWTFSAAEKSAVEKWVLESGGGIIAMTGFLSTPSEPAATSQLIEFADMSFAAPKTAENGQTSPVTYKGGMVNLKTCLAWNGGTVGNEPIITTPIRFTPLTGTLEKLTFGLDYIGAYIGWTVVAPSSATVVAKDPMSGGNIVVAREVDGKGRVLALGDEWAIFANQWQPTGTAYDQNMNAANICWQPPAGNAAGFFHSVQTLYQTKQFWFDAINWVAPPNECNFVVQDPDVQVPR